MSNIRLSWNEICTEYPNQTVALTDVMKSNESTVISAVVLFAEKRDNMSPADIAAKAFLSDGSIVAENTADSLLCATANAIC